MSQGILDCQAKDRFWKVVEECLVKFHDYQRCDAQREAAELRSRIEKVPNGLSGDVIYHDEPFDVAGDIAGRPLDLSRRRKDYETITRMQNW